MEVVDKFTWNQTSSFLNRAAERDRLEQWWKGPDHRPINLYGRRRTGKSWLFRRVADGKPAVILVARELAPGQQLNEFAEQLTPVLGVRPDIPDVPSLFRILLRAGASQKYLAVVDEFSYLLPRGKVAVDRMLSAIAAVFEEELGASRVKLIMCGSTVATMESLQLERNPLHARLTPLNIRPLPYEHARTFMSNLKPIEAFERFAIAGGMPRYLSLLASGALKKTLCEQVIDRNAPLYKEVPAALNRELIEPAQHFSILEQLASGDKTISEIADPLKQTSGSITSYLESLTELRIVERRLPLGAAERARGGHWNLTDPFFGFWFRFVFPYQDQLENGLAPEDLFDAEVGPAMSEHVSHVFEDWCRTWVRQKHGKTATTVGSWWGNSLNQLRRSGERSTEEIDIVGTARSVVTLVGEVKWTNKPMTLGVLRDLETYKMPALIQAGMKLAASPRIVLLSRSGYADSLVRRADADPDIELVDVRAALT